MLTLKTPHLEKLLGSGNYGKVYTAQWNNKKVAVKIIQTTTKMGYTQVLQELHALTYIPCEFNRCELFGCYVHDNSCIGIIMELCDFDLFQLIESVGYLSESKTISIFRDVVRALAFMHSHNLYHCDIKLENLMIKDGKVRVVDFGLMNSQKCAGSQTYSPPETWQKGGTPGPHTDVWALSICLYACLMNGFPWDIANNIDDRYRLILGFKTTSMVEAIFKHYGKTCGWSKDCIQLLDAMLTVNVENRIKMKHVCESSWFN